jgi:hypothetical protein
MGFMLWARDHQTDGWSRILSECWALESGVTKILRNPAPSAIESGLDFVRTPYRTNQETNNDRTSSPIITVLNI